LKTDQKFSRFWPQLPNEAGTTHFSMTPRIRILKTLPLLQFQGIQSVRGKVTAKKPLFEF
jgi:hypothetical protein